ncbi:MAG: hypothetical protein WCJ29_02785 [bacterium]
MPLNDKQRQLALAAVVVVLAIGIGYMLGKRPAISTPLNTNVATEEKTVTPKAVDVPTTPTPSGTTTKTPAKTTSPTATDGEPIAPMAKTGTISFVAKSGNGGVNFNWSMPSNLTAPFGFVIFKSTTTAPSFPRDEHKFITNPADRTYTWDVQDGNTYWFKICTWNGKANAQTGCLTTSSAAKAVAPTASAAETQNPFDYTAIELGLAGRVENDGVRLFWSQSTSSSFISYKVVRSTSDTNPYYPKTPAIATLNTKTDVGTMDNAAVKGAKYFYRVCVVRTGLNPQCGSVWTVTY